MDASLPNRKADDITQFAYRTVSDHMRSICVAIGDGLSPSRLGLGAYLKHLIIKTIKISKKAFEIKDDRHLVLLLTSLVPVVAKSLYQAYPNILADTDRIQEVCAFVCASTELLNYI